MAVVKYTFVSFSLCFVLDIDSLATCLLSSKVMFIIKTGCYIGRIKAFWKPIYKKLEFHKILRMQIIFFFFKSEFIQIISNIFS